jgi:hypothetical protein
VPKIRTLIEADTWQPSLAVLASPRRWDEAFRAAAYNIATKPYANTTPFLSNNHRILTVPIPGVVTLYVYFRVDPDDNTCTLLWVESLGGPRVLNRVG